ncbi:elongation initiation factor 2 alpha subunit, putative [Trypanosoma cruzi]|uniref:Elongation initiation factor 2 alpha subunit n=2 Tax=Trypanosoma cruzi TaxID=5693 RepID=V5BSN3_TRYCR|nr:elongation initiation factor 2 alpha subunit, putative [Trypanosoma cruzi]ESS70884.1 elongation initiation factor 2 alpha subunit [Trypanosoma cruzi Dm28c]PBJ72723.1 eukaryotic initiation factor 2a [Trypanosoma cruzi cruzi]KAF8276105.1 eukaryotic translation initiation factor 2 subunit alpha [Trypanosoma cruzi]PWU95153.1 Eukaryotic translation initiation factor 2 subunit alpha [Trypanosoma cruzi]
MASHGPVKDIERVDYSTKCCCRTTDEAYYQAPKQYFVRHPTLSRRKLTLTEPFNVPFDASTFEKVLIELEKASILSAAAAVTVDTEQSGGDNTQKPQWMKDLDKRQQRFLAACLGVTTWDGRDVCFYEEKLPKENDVVWVKVIQVNDTSAVVQLLEYGNHEGIIPYTEITRIRIRAIGKVIKVGRNEAAQVIRIDKEKGYIDLSKKQVTLKEAKECEARFLKGNEVRSIVCHVADECGIPAAQAMEMIAYPLYRRQPGKHAWDWLHELNRNRDVEGILGPLHLPEKAQKLLLATLEHTVRNDTATIHADIEMTCFQCDGVNALREVLLLGRRFKADQEPQIPISVTIVGPPRYRLRARTEEREEGMRRMRETIETMAIEIAKRGGILRVVHGPYALGEEEQLKDEPNDDQDDDDDETD